MAAKPEDRRVFRAQNAEWQGFRYCACKPGIIGTDPTLYSQQDFLSCALLAYDTIALVVKARRLCMTRRGKVYGTRSTLAQSRARALTVIGRLINAYFANLPTKRVKVSVHAMNGDV